MTVGSVDLQARAENEKDCLPFSSAADRGLHTWVEVCALVPVLQIESRVKYQRVSGKCELQQGDVKHASLQPGRGRCGECAALPTAGGGGVEQ